MKEIFFRNEARLRMNFGLSLKFKGVDGPTPKAHRSLKYFLWTG